MRDIEGLMQVSSRINTWKPAVPIHCMQICGWKHTKAL